MTPTLTDLASRVQELTGPCRETDYLICEAMHPFLAKYGYQRTEGDSGYYSATPSISGGEKIAPASEYTGSWDAMIFLLPDGAEYQISTIYGQAEVDLPLNSDPTQTVRRKDGKASPGLHNGVLNSLSLKGLVFARHDTFGEMPVWQITPAGRAHRASSGKGE